MGWRFPWYSSHGSDFNYDFHVTMDPAVAPVEYNYKDAETLAAQGLTHHLQGEAHGLSVFVRDGERVLHTYSVYGRGLDPLLNTQPSRPHAAGPAALRQRVPPPRHLRHGRGRQPQPLTTRRRPAASVIRARSCCSCA